MSAEQPQLTGPNLSDEERLKQFARDQVEAVKIAREERKNDSNSRYDACHLAMRYLETFNHGVATTNTVITIAKVFEVYLNGDGS